MLAGTFDVMEGAGEGVMRPFLQDVLRVDGLVSTSGGLMLRPCRGSSVESTTTVTTVERER